MYINSIILFLVFSLILVIFSRKYNFLIDNKKEKHKKYTYNLKSYSVGGILLISFILFYSAFFFNNFMFFIFLTSIFLVGLFSDLKKLNSVSLRFFLQIITIIFFTNLLNIEINSTKLPLFDELLKYRFLNIIFVTFCLTVLLNGTNFIDGINGLTIKYYLIVYLIIFIFFQQFAIDHQFIKYLIPILLILLLFNLFGFLYLGDSGAYLISILTGIFLIDVAFDNPAISPYFITILLWYPCFELLFSILRRLLKNNKTYKPDTNHLHQLIFTFIDKKFKLINPLMTHFYSSLCINIFNLISFLISLKFIYNSTILITILFINIIIYIFVFSILIKLKLSSK